MLHHCIVVITINLFIMVHLTIHNSSIRIIIYMRVSSPEEGKKKDSVASFRLPTNLWNLMKTNWLMRIYVVLFHFY